MSTNFNFVSITSGAGSVNSQTFSSIIKGNIIIAYISGGSSSSSPGACSDITDSQTNQYYLVQAGNSASAIYAAIAKSPGSLTLTNNIGGTAFIAAQYSSLAAFYICAGSAWLPPFATSNINFNGNTVSPTTFSSPDESMVIYGRSTASNLSYTVSKGTIRFQGVQQVGTINNYTYAFGDDNEPSLTTSYTLDPLINGTDAGGGASVILNLTRVTCLGPFAGLNTLSITCGSPPNGTVGVTYSHTFPVAGGTPPDVFSISSGSLPPGLNLNTSTGAVSGLPTVAGTYSFVVQVTDSLSNTAVTPTCSITIAASVIPIANCNNPPNGSLGVFYSHTLTATNGTPPYVWAISSGSLPPGLTLSASGVISGTPSQVGTFSFTATVTDANSLTASCSVLIVGGMGGVKIIVNLGALPCN